MLVHAEGFQSLLPTTFAKKGATHSNRIKSSVRDTPEIATRKAKGDEANFDWNKQVNSKPPALLVASGDLGNVASLAWVD